MLSIAEFSLRNGICRTKVYDEIRSGRLRAVKVGRRTLISLDAERDWRNSRPQWPSPPSQPAFAGLMAAA